METRNKTDIELYKALSTIDNGVNVKFINYTGQPAII